MATTEEIRAQSYVGFDSITQQIEHKLLKRGFQFNVIVVVVGVLGLDFCLWRGLEEGIGWCSIRRWVQTNERLATVPFVTPEHTVALLLCCYTSFTRQTGLGKSTLINTIFASHLIDSKGRLVSDEPVRQTTEIQAVSHGAFTLILHRILAARLELLPCTSQLIKSLRRVVIVENGVRLRLNIVDTPGYGDQINNEGCWDPIIKYIKDQHSAYLRKELTAQRERYIQDTRIHCCLYFINPTGHSLRPVDIIVMKKLSDVVNVVPVIAKSDSLTLEERDRFKAKIREELVFNNIRLYPFDTDEYDEEEVQLNESIRDIIPFAVVGSENNVVIDGKSVRGRKNRWGVVNVEDPNHCEFVNLRNFLTRTHLQDLIETTAQIHYEAFRSKQLLALKDGVQQRPPQQAQ
ncbi:hypothetical protein D9756_001273 [Leucocoprinus leucothites]|uniref:Septin-type G domain-containing protein n=1 Tax=Leucocoprinus leucothites TaxID=201217 RepID=A0A8H5LI22_9AGAR|nr:hypothetical protein D9756_001273 [Leucoagaricus leucothites]